MACELTDFFVMLQLWILVNVTIQACDPPCLYFSAGEVIKSIELFSKKVTSNVTESQAHDGRVLAVAVDVEEKTLYFSDQVSRTIRRIDLKSSRIEDVASEVGHCEDMAIDWVNKYIYWTDNKNGRIEMSRVDGSDRKLLFDRDIQHLRGITVDPVHGYMFWTDYGDNPKIERATLAGQERTTIIVNTIITRLKYPNDVIVDYTSYRIYWVDGGLNVIGTADLNGRNIKMSKSIKNSKLFALAVYNNTLYITDSEMNAKSIIVADKESLREIDRFTQPIIGSRDLFGLTMLHESRQPTVISPCSHGNGGCSHLCFIVPDGYSCGCPNGTALREDGYCCQEANFTNCRNQPCLNGGTCYFNFQRFADDCTCSKYYTEKDCGLYLGAGAVGVTLEMNVEEWEKEKFKQAITRGLDDYCKRDNCGLRNESISKQFCPCFLNNSARLNVTQITVIGQPVASLPSHTKVDFAVILRPVSSSKPLVAVNTTLEYIIWDRANFISKHLNKIVLVNNLHPSSDTRCNDVKPTQKEEETMRGGEEKTKTIAMAIGIPSFVVILLVSAAVAVILYRRKRHIRANQLGVNNDVENNYEFHRPEEQRQNQPRDNSGVENEDGYDEVGPRAEQRQNQPRDNNGVENGDGYDEVGPRAERRQSQPRENNGEGNNGRDNNIDGNEEQRGNQQKRNNGEGSNDRNRIAVHKNINDRQGSFVNLDIVDNRKGDYLDGQRSAPGNEDMSSPKGWPMLQETSIGAMGNLNIPGNQHNERDCEVTCENVAHENDNQQLEEAYEDMNASQALATSATARHPIENDDDVSGTYTNPVQCTDDIK